MKGLFMKMDVYVFNVWMLFFLCFVIFCVSFLVFGYLMLNMILVLFDKDVVFLYLV